VKPANYSAGLGVASGALVSWEQRICPIRLMTRRKVVIYIDYPQEAYAWCTWTGVGSVHVALIGFSPVEYISIRITVTLRYE
jgi:hypothetical protein